MVRHSNRRPTRRQRAIALGTGAVALVLTTTACGAGTQDGATAGDDTTPRVAVFMGEMENRYMSASLEGTKEIIEAAGGTVDAFDGNFDPALQSQQIQDALASGKYNGFVVGAVNNTALVPVLEEAIAEGIVVTSNGFPLGPDISTNEAQIQGQAMSAVESSSHIGELVGTATVQACEDKDPCEVVYMSGDPGISFEQLKFDEFSKAIDGHDNIDVVTRATADYTADSALQVMSDVLVAHPDVDVMASNSDQMADGAAQAGTAAGANFVVIGQGGSEIAEKGVEDGTWYASVLGLPKDEGIICAEAIIATLKGEKVDPNYWSPVEKAGYTGGLMTKQFLEEHPDFTPQWSG